MIDKDCDHLQLPSCKDSWRISMRNAKYMTIYDQNDYNNPKGGCLFFFFAACGYWNEMGKIRIDFFKVDAIAILQG